MRQSTSFRASAPLLLLALLYGCGGGGGDIKAKDYKGRLEDAKMGLTFQCPQTWEVRENVQGHRAIARSRLESRGDNFQENLVVTGPLKGSLQEVRDRCDSEFKKLQNYKSLAAPPDILDFEHEMNGLPLHCRAYLQPRPAGDYWMVTFTDTVADFSKHEKDFVAIMSTFGKPLAPLPTASPSASATASDTPAAPTTPPPSSTPAPATPAATPTAPPPASTPAPATPAATPTAPLPASTPAPATPAPPPATATPGTPKPGATP